MKKKLIIRSVMRAGLLCFAILGVASCTEPPSSPAQGGSVIAMRTQIDNSNTNSPVGNTHPPGASVDSLQVIQAAFAAHNFMVRSDVSDDVADPNLAYGFIHEGSFVLAFDMMARQYIGENIIYAATYIRSRFDLQPIHTGPDSLTLLYGPYASLFEEGGAVSSHTIIIKGFVWKDGSQMPFIYSTNMTGGISVLFDSPLNVPAGGAPMEVFVHFSSAAAFTDKSGSLMDPRDNSNASAIDANIKISLKAALHAAGSQ